MTLDPRADRTALRLKLYENGFTPLANKSKMCLIKEWSTLKVTPDLIQSRQWARSNAFLDTGLRCGGILALDFDVDDKDLLNDLLDAVIELGLVEESPFVRIGKPPRELWVYRTSDKIGKRTTGHFLPADAPEDNSGYAVEVLGAGCQFAAFGQRDEHTAYQWPEQSLLDHEYMDLPVITLKQVDALKDFCEVFFTGRGLVRRSPGGGTDAGYTHAYDLTPEMIFNAKDLGDVTVEELTTILQANPEETLRCSVETFRPTSGSWAGMASLVNGELCISDHGTYTSHFPVAADSATSMEELGRLMAERFPVALDPVEDLLNLPEMDPRGDLDDNLVIALQRYAYVVRDARVCDMAGGFTMTSVADFRNHMAPYHAAELGKRGGEKLTYLADQWLLAATRINVHSAVMRPDQPRPVFVEQGRAYINTYQPPRHPRGGTLARVEEFFAYLLPDAFERSWFLQWLSYKLQNPGVPGPAVIMVASDSFGTGRGTLMRMLERLFGDDYVKRVDFDTLTGRGTQSQYNEWQTESLIATVEEAKEGSPGLSSWQTRTSAYEHLKTVIEPAARRVHVKRKGLKNEMAHSSASIMIMTNHSDAIVVPPNDRRLAVLSNGTAAPVEFWVQINAWMDDPRNIGALDESLRQIDLSTYTPYAAPPMTSAKADMVDAGSSDLDRAIAAVMAGARGQLMVKEQFLLLIEAAMTEHGSEFPDDWTRIAERLFPRKTRRLLGPERRTVEGKPRVVRALGPVDPGLLQNDAAVLEEILKNGPLVRPIKTSGNIVSFSGQRNAL